MSQYGDFGMLAGQGYSDPLLEYTKFLSGFEGADGATTFVDESPANHTPDFGGLEGSAISTTQFKFGSSSLKFDGSPSTEALSVADSADWFFSTGAWSAEAWVRPSSVSSARFVLGQTDNLSNITNSAWGIWMFGGVPRLTFFDSVSSGGRDVIGTSTLSINTWAHLAVDFDTTKIRLYVNGTMEGSFTYSGSFRDVGRQMMIGNTFARTAVYAGYIDEVRVLKGIAPWASDGGFTTPSEPYARN